MILELQLYSVHMSQGSLELLIGCGFYELVMVLDS